MHLRLYDLEWGVECYRPPLARELIMLSSGKRMIYQVLIPQGNKSTMYLQASLNVLMDVDCHLDNDETHWRYQTQEARWETSAFDCLVKRCNLSHHARVNMLRSSRSLADLTHRILLRYRLYSSCVGLCSSWDCERTGDQDAEEWLGGDSFEDDHLNPLDRQWEDVVKFLSQSTSTFFEVLNVIPRCNS